MLYVSDISKQGHGFYSMFFLLLDHYIYCKKHNISHILYSSDWLFKYQKGWEDYFTAFQFIRNNNISEKNIVTTNDIRDEYPIYEYRDAIKDVYIFNEKIKNKIVEYKVAEGIIKKSYDALFIRRGDKLCLETQYIPTEKYMEKLLEKNPTCNTLWIQTDDYNVIIDANNYVVQHGLNIEIKTLCDPNMKGMVIFNTINKETLEYYAKANPKYEGNSEYMSQVLENLKTTKPVNEMNPDEIYQHMMDMLIGIDIVLHSNICVCDYFSNVSRFIKLAHDDYNSVYDVYRPTAEIDLNTIKCPAFTCSFYPGL